MVCYSSGLCPGWLLTANIFMIFFFWEITALCSYQLISFYNDDPNAVRGGLKALFITQFGGIGLMVAGLLIFGYTNSFEIGRFIQAAQGGEIPANILGIIGFTLIIAATAKSAQFPFFTWLPDAMEAPTPVSALIHAATMVNAGVYLLCRFFPALVAIPLEK
jgi:NADH-quinone oxidoreductase subunit L